MAEWICIEDCFANPDGSGTRFYRRGAAICIPEGKVPTNPRGEQHTRFVPADEYSPPMSPVQKYQKRPGILPSYRAPIDEQKAARAAKAAAKKAAKAAETATETPVSETVTSPAPTETEVF